MLLDFNEAWSRASEARYDVVVCGTGPAGITVARKLAALGKHVALLEAGGLELTEESQNVYEGQNIGLQYWGLAGCRLRYFGGTSNHWAGRCGALDPIDFEQRKIFGRPGWPISRDDVLSFLAEARGIVDIGDQPLSAPDEPPLAGTPFKRAGSAESPPTRFGEKYLDEIKSSQRIDAFLNANVTDVQLNDKFDHVSSLDVRNYRGDSAKLTARRYVLALGAIENARMLLNSDKQVPGGLGNASDLVGRCFMEHLNYSLGRFLVSNPEFWKRKELGLAPTEAFMREQQIGNGIVAFDSNFSPRSYGRLKHFKQALRLALCQSQSATEIARSFVDYDCPGDGVITSLIEQLPNPNSRVTLGEERDAFGLRRVRLDWQLNDADRRTVGTLAFTAAKELARLDLARVRIADFVLDHDKQIEVGGHCHHMGTTRMSESPGDGVVDPNSQVHGIDNLYLAGSSVFPTGGGINPTLTIVMLALRLGEHLGRLS